MHWIRILIIFPRILMKVQLIILLPQHLSFIKNNNNKIYISVLDKLEFVFFLFTRKDVIHTLQTNKQKLEY